MKNRDNTLTSEMYKIYALICPFEGKIRYIGKTCTALRTRLMGHIKNARKAKNPNVKESWIKAIIGSGLQPEIKMLLYTENLDEALRLEKEKIQEHKDTVFNIQNFKLKRRPKLRSEWKPKSTGHRVPKLWKAIKAKHLITKEIRCFPSLADAEKELGIKSGTITNALKPNGGSAKSWLFIFANESEKNFDNKRPRLRQVERYKEGESVKYKSVTEAAKSNNLCRRGLHRHVFKYPHKEFNGYFWRCCEE